jgi:flagellar hook-associated protein 1 FlgK
MRSTAAGARLRAQEDAGHSTNRLEALVDQDAGRRIDLDAEMQHLLTIEKAYAAHARVIEAASDMLDRLTRI